MMSAQEPAAPASWREAVAQRARSTLRRMYPAGPSSSEPFLEEEHQQQQIPESTSWAASDLSIVRSSSTSLPLPLTLAAKASRWARESIVSAKTAASQLRQGVSQWLGGGNKRTAAPHLETASYSQRLLSGATQRFAQLKLLVAARRGQSDAAESLPPPPPPPPSAAPAVLQDSGEPLAVVVDSVAPAEAAGALETTAAAAAATTSDQGEQTAADEAVFGTGEQQMEATTPLMNPGDTGQEREREREREQEADAATEPTAVAEGAEADELPKEAEPELAQAADLEPSSQQAE
jgi:hypothetical protein